MIGDNRKRFFYTFIYLFIVAYVTLFSRTPALQRITHFVPLWSYLSTGHEKQILLNILLFIPLGFFYRSIVGVKSSFFFSLVTSMCVELLQFFSYRGMLDIDDLVSNLFGAIIGIVISNKLKENNTLEKYEKWIQRAMLVAGIIGCVIMAQPEMTGTLNESFERQFDFRITSLFAQEDSLTINGYCYTYNRETPTYKLIINNESISPVIIGSQFSATTELPREKAEIQISFKGYSVISTKTWIRPIGNTFVIDYVEGYPQIPDVVKTGVLKAYCEEFDSFVFQDGDKLIWLISRDIDKDAQIIYHIYTDEPEKLPKDRINFGFENRDFSICSLNEPELGKYIVFTDTIPHNYKITAIIVGLKTKEIIAWRNSFRVE